MEFGIISLGDIQTGPSTGKAATAAQRVDDAIGYATLAERTGLPRRLVEESITRLATEIAPQVRAAIGKTSPDKASTTA